MRCLWRRSADSYSGRTYWVLMVIWTLIFPPTLFSPQRVLAAFVDATKDRLSTTIDATNSFAIGDVDGDGDPDVVVVNVGQSSLLLNDGHGQFTDVTTDHFPDLALTAMAAALGDVDGDDDLDLVLANVKGQNLLLLNDGRGVFTDVTTSHLPLSTQVSMSVQLGDIDGDGDLDLVVVNRGSQNRLYLNNGLGVFTDATASQLPESNNEESIDALFADVDADGTPDLLITAGKDPLRLLLNDGAGHFTDATTTHIPALNTFGIKVLAGDLDNDGAPDLVLATVGQDRILLNDGSGHFHDATATLLPVDTQRSFGLALLDADQDLDLDLLLGTPQGVNRLLLNALTMPRLRLAATPAYKEVGTPVTLTAAAFDEDGLASATLTLTDPASHEQTIALLTDLADGRATHTFTPVSSGAYTATLTAVDTHGETQTRRVVFAVHAVDDTTPQVTIAVETPAPIVFGHAVTLRVTATDEQGVAHMRLLVNETPVSLDSAGLATYLPATHGIQTAVVHATDMAGNTSTTATTFVVEADTAPPVVSLGVIPDEVALTQPVTITVETTDNVAVTDRVLHLTGPAIPAGLEVAIDAAGRATYTPFQPGTYILVATARDSSGNTATATATFTATGVSDTIPPVVHLSGVPTTVALGSTVIFTMTATDDTEVTATTLEINDTPLLLDAAGSVTYTPSVVGTYTVVAVARDATGNTGTALATFRVIDAAGDTTPPVVRITTPVAHASLPAPTVILGTVRDETLVRYTLEYAPQGTDAFTPFATGTTEVADGVLGTLDTSLLLNDLYNIRLTAEDANGRVTSTRVVYQVAGNLKIGHFSITLEDLAIPVAGLPITVTRTYDSRDTRSGDFGVGWHLDIQSVKVRESGLLGTGWLQGRVNTFTYCIQPEEEHYVTIILPDGRSETFDMTLEPACQTLLPIQETTVNFTPRRGTASRLDALTDNVLSVVGGLTAGVGTMSPVELIHFDDSDDLGRYDPVHYRLSTSEGLVFALDQTFGVRTITEPNGHSLTFGPNGIIHSAGKSVVFTRDAQGRITQVTDPIGNTITYTYDTNGDLIAVTDQEGYTSRYTYDAMHHLVTVEDPRGITPARNIYDEAGRLIAHVDAEGHRIEYSHDIEGRQEIVRDRLGYITLYTYDDIGNVLSQTDALGHSTTFTYDERGNKLTETDPLGNTTTYTYDDRDNLLTQSDPLGNTTTYTYNARNQVLTLTDPLGYLTTHTYDARGNLRTTTDPMGSATTHTYDTRGHLLSTTNSLGHTTTYAYDAAGNRITQTDPLGHVIIYTYDANGNQLTETTTRTDGQGHLTSLTTTKVYDPKNRVIQTIDPARHTTLLAYNPLGKLSATVDKNGNRTAFAYDPMGYLTKTTFPDGTTETFTYDAQGNRLDFMDRVGRTTQYGYDAVGRLIQTIFPDSSSTQTTYDAASRVIASINERGYSTTFAYDAAGRRTQVIDALGYATTYTYDSSDNLIRLTDANGHTTAYDYDALRRPTRTIFPDGTWSTVAFYNVPRKLDR